MQPVSNDFIADQFSLLSRLMDIHGENSFKTKSYSIAAFTIDKLPDRLAEMPREKIFAIKGIGEATGKKILEILDTGELKALRDIIAKTPAGVLDMLRIKGLGPKKIAVIWKEMDIESVGELLYACQENRLLLYKGFGAKTQQSIADTIGFHLMNQGSHLYASIEAIAGSMDDTLKKTFSSNRFELTGEFRRQLEIINRLEWVTDADRQTLLHWAEDKGFTPMESAGDQLLLQGPDQVKVLFHFSLPNQIPLRLFQTSASEEFLEAWHQAYPTTADNSFASEESLFSENNIPFIPPFLREQASIIGKPSARLIEPADIRAIVHCHSNWSDGSNTIEEMAGACIAKGLEWMAISDHSKSAFYANGLSEERIREQHAYIDELNAKLAPFHIFKSIECDILNDGSLDYSNEILSTFDLVITSVHSNLKMPEEKAMMRLLGAIENPYTTILGHMTGRLLLSRPGYPVDHSKIIEACRANQVVIELNAHPRRLDMDWRWIGEALEKSVLISIDPDAHSIAGFNDTRYGVLAARKAGLTANRNLSSFSLAEMKQFLSDRKKAKGLA